MARGQVVARAQVQRRLSAEPEEGVDLLVPCRHRGLLGQCLPELRDGSGVVCVENPCPQPLIELDADLVFVDLSEPFEHSVAQVIEDLSTRLALIALQFPYV